MISAGAYVRDSLDVSRFTLKRKLDLLCIRHSGKRVVRIGELALQTGYIPEDEVKGEYLIFTNFQGTVDLVGNYFERSWSRDRLVLFRYRVNQKLIARILDSEKLAKTPPQVS